MTNLYIASIVDSSMECVRAASPGREATVDASESVKARSTAGAVAVRSDGRCQRSVVKLVPNPQLAVNSSKEAKAIINSRRRRSSRNEHKALWLVKDEAVRKSALFFDDVHQTRGDNRGPLARKQRRYTIA